MESIRIKFYHIQNSNQNQNQSIINSLQSAVFKPSQSRNKTFQHSTFQQISNFVICSAKWYGQFNFCSESESESAVFSNPCVSLFHIDRTAAGSPVKALDDHNDIWAPGAFSGSATASATGSASALQCGTTVNVTNVEFLNLLILILSLGLRLSKKSLLFWVWVWSLNLLYSIYCWRCWIELLAHCWLSNWHLSVWVVKGPASSDSEVEPLRPGRWP